MNNDKYKLNLKVLQDILLPAIFDSTCYLENMHFKHQMQQQKIMSDNFSFLNVLFRGRYLGNLHMQG